ncbi:hypothetical protein [Tahibacter amnicola]|uniref:Uncharacterized protein n=1 Tax=Tahibacter amnicola TaxID=2976241 RepID=A0ABY6BK38_9GAMM|nr:hypothetical protein [Tahibacter amnicola]UXI70259.1 hypothetical protein N4264_11670 [Tahibacter amnicola]
MIYLVAGSILTSQPLWSVFGASDAADLITHPAYVLAVGFLLFASSRAAKRVPKQHADRAVAGIESILKGEDRPSEEGASPMMTFHDDVNASARKAYALAVLGLLLGWYCTLNVGGKVTSVAKSYECNLDLRVVAYSKGFIGIGRDGSSQLVFTRDPAAYLCGKAEAKPSVATPPQVVQGDPKGGAEKDGSGKPPVADKASPDGRKAPDDGSKPVGQAPKPAPITVIELAGCSQTPPSARCALTPMADALTRLTERADAVDAHLQDLKGVTTRQLDAQGVALASIQKSTNGMFKSMTEQRSQNIFQHAAEKLTGRKKGATGDDVPVK